MDILRNPKVGARIRGATALAVAVGVSVVAIPASAAETTDLPEGYESNLTVQERVGGTVDWEDIGADGAVTLSTPANEDQAVVFLPVIPLGLTYPSMNDITTLGYEVVETTGEAANLVVEFAAGIAGPYQTAVFIPPAGTEGPVDADAGAYWLDRTTEERNQSWADLQDLYGDSFINKIYISLGTGQNGASSSVDSVTVNDDLYNFVYTGVPPTGDLDETYRNGLTVQEVGDGTVDWEATMCTNGAVTLTTGADADQAVVNLPVLPLGLGFTMEQLTDVSVAVADTSNINTGLNIQVADSASGPFVTLQRQVPPDFTGVDASTEELWMDRGANEDNLTWAELQSRYAGYGVNRVWLSVGTNNGASSSSVDYVTLNDQVYDFTVAVPAVVPAPALPASVPGSVDGALVVDPATVDQGGSVMVSGEGFEPASPVNVGLYDPKAGLGGATSDEAGAFESTVVVPAAAAAGENTVLAIGGSCAEDYSVGERVLTGDLTVTEVVVPPCIDGGTCFMLKDSLAGGAADHTFAYGKPSDAVLIGDWDGDGASTVTVRRGNVYYEKNSLGGGEADRSYSFGRADDQVLVGDWDGDGTDTLAVRRGKQYYFDLDGNGGAADKVIAYGLASDEVFAGDWDGDGVDTLSVRRGNVFYEKNAIAGGDADRMYSFGKPGDLLVVGDWDGDGTDTLSVRRGNQYHFDIDGNGGTADQVVGYGRAGDEVFAGDWNADDSDTLGVRR